MTVGVFDSGIGGRSVANALELAYPEVKIIFRNDSNNVPYGTKTVKQLRRLVEPILYSMVEESCDLIIIACNTVSTTILDELKSLMTVPIIGMEPMVCEASQLTVTKTIAVCATPTTLNSFRYNQLKSQYAKDVQVLEPDCSKWALMIETNKLDRQEIEKNINDVCLNGADVIVLGCTHYHWIEDIICSVAKNRAKIIQPEEKIIEEVRKYIK